MMIDFEQIRNMDGVERARDELRSELRVVDEAVQKANQAATNARAEIADLEENVLPGLMADRFFDDKISKAELTKVKKRRVELQEIVDDLPLLLKGLESKQHKINSECRRVEHRERFIQGYEKVKVTLTEKYSPALEQIVFDKLEQSLLDKAEVLGCKADARKFLKDLKAGQVKS